MPITPPSPRTAPDSIPPHHDGLVFGIEEPNVEVVAYCEAMVQGITAGLKGFAEAVVHPLDNVVYPLLRTAYDAGIILAQHSPPHPDMEELQAFLKQYPEVYLDSLGNMKAHVDTLKQVHTQWVNGSGPECTAMVAEGVTSVFAPGYALKALGALSKMAVNKPFFGTFKEPPLFHNLIEHEFGAAIPVHPLEYLEVDFLRKTIGRFVCNFVLTAKKELLIARKRPLFDTRFNETHHHRLAGLEPLYAAGELYFVDGKLIYANVGSGHYLPFGDHLGPLIERRLVEKGIAEAIGKYKPLRLLGPLSEELTPIVTEAKKLFDPKFTLGEGMAGALNTVLPKEEHADSLLTDMVDFVDGVISMNTASASMRPGALVAKPAIKNQSPAQAFTQKLIAPRSMPMDYSHILEGIHSVIEGIDDAKLTETAFNFFITLDEQEHVTLQSVAAALQKDSDSLRLNESQAVQYQYLINQILKTQYFEKESDSQTRLKRPFPPRINKKIVSAQLHQTANETRTQLATHVHALNEAISNTPELAFAPMEATQAVEYQPTFNDYAQTVGQSGELAAHIAMLTGHPREAQVISTVTSSAVTIGIAVNGLIAGTLFGPLGWLMIANGVLGCVSGLTQGSDKSLEQMMKGIQALAGLIYDLHKRFDRLDAKLDRQYLALLDGFSALHLSQAITQAKLNTLYEQVMQSKEATAASFSALKDKLDNFQKIIVGHHLSTKESDLKKLVLKIVNKNEPWNEDSYDTMWVELMGALNQDATLPLLTGSAVDPRDPRAVAVRLDGYDDPTAVGYEINLIANSINTIGRFYRSRTVGAIYTPEIVNQLLSELISQQQADSTVLEKPKPQLIEAAAVVSDAVPMNAELFYQALAIPNNQVIWPIPVGKGWALVFANNAPGKESIVYFNPNPQEGGLPKAFEIACETQFPEIPIINASYLLSSHAEDSASLVIQASKWLLHGCAVADLIDACVALKREGMAGITALKIEQLSLIPESMKFMPADLPNPLIWSYLTTSLLFLMNAYHGGPTCSALPSGHGIKQAYVDQLQSVIEEGDKIANMIDSLRNPTLLQGLIDQYQNALLLFKRAFDAEVSLYNRQFDDQLNTGFDEKADKTLDWLRQNADFMRGKIQGYEEKPHLWFRSYGFSGGKKSDNAHNVLGAPTTKYTVNAVASYKDDREKSIREQMKALVIERTRSQNTLTPSRLHILGHPEQGVSVEINPHKIARVMLPFYRDSGSTYYPGERLALPLPDKFETLIPVDTLWYQAEALGLGSLQYYYYDHIDASQKRLISHINIRVCFNSPGQLLPSKTCVAFKTFEFVATNPYNRTNFKENAEACLAFWMDNSHAFTGRMPRSRVDSYWRSENYHTHEEQEFPEFETRKGHRNQLKEVYACVDSLRIFNKNYDEQKKAMADAVNLFVNQKRRAFYDDYLIKRLTDDCPLGNAFAALNAAYRMLNATLCLTTNPSVGECKTALAEFRQSLLSADNILTHLKTKTSLPRCEVLPIDSTMIAQLWTTLGSDALFPYLQETLDKAKEYYQAYQRVAVKEVVSEENPAMVEMRRENAAFKISMLEMIKKGHEEQWPPSVMTGLYDSLQKAEEIVAGHEAGLSLAGITSAPLPLTTGEGSRFQRIGFYSQPVAANRVDKLPDESPVP